MMNLRRPGARTRAAVRSGVLTTLMSVLPDLFPEEVSTLYRSSARLSLRGGSVHRRLIFRPGGLEEVSSDGLFFPSLMLNFLHEEGMARKLAGESSPVIPFFLGFRAGAALGQFGKASAFISDFMASHPSRGTPEYLTQTMLLLHAALRGVCEVGLHDHWLAVKAAGLPDGILEICAGDERQPDFRARLLHSRGDEGHSFTYLPGGISAGADDAPGRDAGTAESAADGGRPRARLRFESLETAGAILRSEMNAMDALGSGAVKINGKIPFIQGIFPLLDRFGEIMSYKG